MIQAIMQAAVMVDRGRNPSHQYKTYTNSTKKGSPTLKQPTFNWKTPDKYHELCNFKSEVKSFFQTNNYNIVESKTVPVINCFSHKGLRFVQSVNDKQEKCKISSGLFEVLSDKYKSEHNEMILLLQCCKLARKDDENVEEGMGHLGIKANECDNKERIGG